MARNIKIRKMLASDLEQILALFRVANGSRPAMDALYPPEVLRDAMFYLRYGFYLAHPEWHQCLTAALNSSPEVGEGEEDGEARKGKEEVVGCCVGNSPRKWVVTGEDGVKKEMEREEWKPDIPEGEGTKIEFFTWLKGRMKEDSESHDIERLWELEALTVSPWHERMGIGSKLLTAWLEIVNTASDAQAADGEKERGVFVKASSKGKGLYEKFGWKTISALELDLKQWGVDEVLTVWNMVRGLGTRSDL